MPDCFPVLPVHQVLSRRRESGFAYPSIHVGPARAVIRNHVIEWRDRALGLCGRDGECGRRVPRRENAAVSNLTCTGDACRRCRQIRRRGGLRATPSPPPVPADRSRPVRTRVADDMLRMSMPSAFLLAVANSMAASTSLVEPLPGDSVRAARSGGRSAPLLRTVRRTSRRCPRQARRHASHGRMCLWAGSLARPYRPRNRRTR